MMPHRSVSRAQRAEAIHLVVRDSPRRCPGGDLVYDNNSRDATRERALEAGAISFRNSRARVPWCAGGSRRGGGGLCVVDAMARTTQRAPAHGGHAAAKPLDMVNGRACDPLLPRSATATFSETACPPTGLSRHLRRPPEGHAAGYG